MEGDKRLKGFRAKDEVRPLLLHITAHTDNTQREGKTNYGKMVTLLNLGQGSTNYGPEDQIQPSTYVFVNKVLLAHGHAHPFTHCL